MNQRYSRPFGNDRPRNNSSYGAYATPMPLQIDPPKPCKPADRFEYNGAFYDRSVLVKLRGTFPIVYVSKDERVKDIKPSEAVKRYPVEVTKGVRTSGDLIFVDQHMEPILVPADYDGKPPAKVYLVTKHSLKKALVTT